MSSAEPTFPRNNNVPPEKPARKQLHTLLQTEPNLVAIEDFTNAKSAPPQIKNYSSAWSLSSPKGDGIERPYHPYAKRPIEPAAAPSTTEDDDDNDEYYDSNDDTSDLKAKKPSYFQEQDEPLCKVVEDGLCRPWNWVEDIPVFPQQQQKSKSVAVPITTLSAEPPPPCPFNFESGGGGGQSPTPNDGSYQAQGGGQQPQYGGSSTGPMGGSPSRQFPPGQPGYPPPPGGIGGPGYIATQPQSMIGMGIPQPGQLCPRCGTGVLYKGFSIIGLVIGLVFFPIGLICCLMMTVAKCPNCGTVFDSNC